MDKLTNELIAKVANKLNLEPALLKTVTVVECGNRDGFLPSGRPQILFEGHVMWKYLKIKLDGEGKRTYLYDLAKRNPSLVYQKWTKEFYLGGEGEWKRLEAARKIDENCANLATSWGLGQIMGFNYQLCGCQSVDEMIQKMSESHEMQLEMMYHFFYNSGLVKHLKAKDWDAFAKGYNGPAYKENNYDQKLRNTYENFKDKL